MLSLGSCKLPGWAWVTNPGAAMMPVLACSRGRGRIQNTNLTCSEAGSEAEPIGEGQHSIWLSLE